MHRSTPARSPRPRAVAPLLIAFGVLASACGGATRSAPPQRAPQVGTAGLTGASLARSVERVLVADRGSISMVARDGCMATVSTVSDPTGSTDELNVRCPRPERLSQWFGGFDQLTASVPLERVAEEDDVELPAAELVTTSGAVLRAKSAADVERLSSAVRALGAELASEESPHPGPESSDGWQMVRVMGTAHVFFNDEPTDGVLDARVSTTGQYFCEFLAHTDSGPIRATKSGWITPAVAAHAIDEVLTPFQATVPGERTGSTFAEGVSAGAPQRANASSTAAVFERFAPIQEALGDACLPELEPPPPIGL